MDTIFVTNRNDFFHEDAFDGVVFGFPPGERVALSMAAAQHMFGFGNANKTEALTRLGWANMQDDAGVKMLAKFVFTEAQLVERVIEEPTEAAASAGA